MKEIRYSELTDAQRSSLKDLGSLAEELPLYRETASYAIGAFGGIIGYRQATMLNGKEPMKWGPMRDPETGKEWPEQPTATALPTVAIVPALPATLNSGSMMVPRAKLFPSPLNPRKSFDAEYLAQLSATIRKQGIINDLVVRPRPGGKSDEFEIVAGECRWRGSEAAQLAFLPVKVRTLNDADVLELMLVENMRRKDLTVIEEGDAFNRALAQKHEDGSPLYPTIEAFAEKIGEKIGYVKQRLALKKLPAAGRTALACDDISFRTARVICAVPETLVGKVLDVVLHPGKHNVWTQGERRALTAEETQSYVRNHVVRELRDTPFQQSDAKLLPAEIVNGERMRGGACTDCPWNSANLPTDEPQTNGKKAEGRPRGDGKWCLNPECFAKKVEIHTAAELVRAKEEGCTILTAEESEKILFENGDVKNSSGFVRLDEKPEFGDRNEKIAEKQLPTWEKIVTGKAKAKIVTGRNEAGEAEHGEVIADVSVPVSIAVTARGHVVKLIERKTAQAAAQKVGTSHFLSLSGGSGRSLTNQNEQERQRKERAELKLRNEASFAAVAELVCNVARDGVKSPGTLFPWLVDVAVWHGGFDSHHFVAKRRGLPSDNSGSEIKALAKKGAPGDQLALALEVLIARIVKFNGVSDALFKRLCAIYGVDSAKIEKEIRAAAATKQKEAKKKEKAKAPKAAPVIKGGFCAWDLLDQQNKRLVRKKYRNEDDSFLALYEYGFDAKGKAVDRRELPKAAVPPTDFDGPSRKTLAKKAAKAARGLSPSARAKIMAAQKARWAARKKGGVK